jgi:hypothetical protein
VDILHCLCLMVFWLWCSHVDVWTNWTALIETDILKFLRAISFVIGQFLFLWYCDVANIWKKKYLWFLSWLWHRRVSWMSINLSEEYAIVILPVEEQVKYTVIFLLGFLPCHECGAIAFLQNFCTINSYQTTQCHVPEYLLFYSYYIAFMLLR